MNEIKTIIGLLAGLLAVFAISCSTRDASEGGHSNWNSHAGRVSSTPVEPGGKAYGDSSTTDSGQEGKVLTPESARAALEVMLRDLSETTIERQVLNTLTGTPIRKEDGDRVSIGPWKCNLAKRTFFFEVVNTDSPLPRFYRKSGVFSQDSRGMWQAVVTEVVQN